MWTVIAGYFKQGWTLLIAFGASALTFLLMRSGKNRREKKEAQARYERAVEIARRDIEIDREHDKRTEDLAEDIAKRRVLGELKDPNDW